MKQSNGMRIFAFISRRQLNHLPMCGAPALAVAGACVLGCLLGCGLSSISPSEVQPGVALLGHVRGGQQPVSGAAIHLYAAGSVGVGAGAVDLLASNAVTTDGSGDFNITGDYVCPSAGTQVYLVARGGNPGLGSGANNPALLMMAALGNCGDLSSATSVVVNEATTVASAWALEQFMGMGAVVGSTASNAVGLGNAFAVARNLADTSKGLAPGSALPSGASTETAKLYTLANVLAACVNSDGGAACAPLFAAATTTQSVPANTLDAALNIVRNPGNNVSAVFNASAAQGPFQPVLAKAPSDLTMSITYGGCTPACGGLNVPGSLAIDSAGNVLVANYYGGVLSKFSAAGVPAAATGIPGIGLNESFGIAIDGADNVWVTNEQSVTAANNHRDGSVSEFSSVGVEMSGYGYTVGGIFYPLAAAADSTGDIWIADYGNSAATLLANDGSAISGGSGYGASQLTFASAVAVDASHDAWFAVQSAAVRVTPAGVVSSFTCCSDPAGIAIDPAGNVWIADYSASAVVELTQAGAVAHRTSLMGGNAGPQGIAVDGGGNVWAANYKGNSVVELAGSSAIAVSPAQGYGLDAPLNEPYGLAIDASGGLWLSNSGANTITQFVGLASPVRTPLLGPPVQP
jgi:streptogramin lyase